MIILPDFTGVYDPFLRLNCGKDKTAVTVWFVLIQTHHSLLDKRREKHKNQEELEIRSRCKWEERRRGEGRERQNEKEMK
jgi:hypothetical protein